MNRRLATALGVYAALIALAVYLLHGKALNVDIAGYPLHVDFLWVVLLVYAALIAKTLIADKAGWTFHSETERSESDSRADQPDSSITS